MVHLQNEGGKADPELIYQIFYSGWLPNRATMNWSNPPDSLIYANIIICHYYAIDLKRFLRYMFKIFGLSPLGGRFVNKVSRFSGTEI